MADKNKFEEFMNSLLNIKAIAIIAVIGAVTTGLISFLKTANEGYNIVFKKPDATLTPETEFKVNDSLTIKGTVDLFTLIKNFAVDETVEKEPGEEEESGVVAVSLPRLVSQF